MGISEDEIVVLFVGRLSFHAKAHPAAMDMAVANAAGNRKVVIVEYGSFPNPQIEQAFEDTARLLAPGVRRIVLDGANHDLSADAWACADIFCSLSDNHQETFGLTPIEAMAAGLPVVVSDWNGYRDTVRDGIDGFRVLTMAPNSDFGSELARQYAQGVLNYDRYCGIASQFVAVDIEKATKAFEALFSSAEMRCRMGEAGESAQSRNTIGRLFTRDTNCFGKSSQIAENRLLDDPNPRIHGRRERIHSPFLPLIQRTSSAPTPRFSIAFAAMRSTSNRAVAWPAFRQLPKFCLPPDPSSKFWKKYLKPGLCSPHLRKNCLQTWPRF